MVVEATMRLSRPPREAVVMVLGVPDMDSVLKVLSAYRDVLEPSAFEFFSELALAKVVEHRGLQRPLSQPAPYYSLPVFR